MVYLSIDRPRHCCSKDAIRAYVGLARADGQSFGVGKYEVVVDLRTVIGAAKSAAGERWRARAVERSS